MYNTDYKPTPIFDHATVEQALETIEDALCYGFELIVENGHVLWRDTLPDTEYTDSHHYPVTDLQAMSNSSTPMEIEITPRGIGKIYHEQLFK